ncbi:MAG: hypothetical protein H0W76_14485 [Pyrinomonadaceae bacterium]|nr:hypothetical protein [Pyrinomonadaceae bacterium]
MLKRLAAFFVVLVIASQTLAGGFACDGDGGHNASEMACCKLAKSNAGATMAMLCCQIACGEPMSGTPGPQSETPSHGQQAPAPTVADIPSTPFHLLFAAVSPLSKKAADALHLRLDPPALYLHNSTFLI